MNAHEKGIEAAVETLKTTIWRQSGAASKIDHCGEVEEIIAAYLQASGLVLLPREPSPADIWQAAMRYRHDAGILPSSDKETLMRTAHWWHDAWVNSFPSPLNTIKQKDKENG